MNVAKEMVSKDGYGYFPVRGYWVEKLDAKNPIENPIENDDINKKLAKEISLFIVNNDKPHKISLFDLTKNIATLSLPTQDTFIYGDGKKVHLYKRMGDLDSKNYEKILSGTKYEIETVRKMLKKVKEEDSGSSQSFSKSPIMYKFIFEHFGNTPDKYSGMYSGYARQYDDYRLYDLEEVLTKDEMTQIKANYLKGIL